MALVLDSCLFGGKGSNPITVIFSTFDIGRGYTFFNRSRLCVNMKTISQIG